MTIDLQTARMLSDTLKRRRRPDPAGIDPRPMSRGGFGSFLSPLLRRNNSLVRGTNVIALGVRAWGDITMADDENWNERRNQVERYRILARETTDSMAARLLHDIVLDLEAELEGSPQNVSLEAA
jgi:hypothetical protein